MSTAKRAWGMARDVIDRTTIYLPIILTAAVALGTYWLVRNAPKLLEPTAKVAPTHEPDYFMRDFVIKNFLPNGDLRSELHGVEGRHYPDTDTMEVDKVRMRSVSPEGLVTRATADRGLSNSDGSEIQLFGNAIVIREPSVSPNGKATPQLEFRGDFLHAYVDTERVTSNKPVTLMRGTDQFTGDTLDYDNLSGVANLNGRVRGVLIPSAAKAAPAAPAKKR
ncbi:lipopolysaccharide export system protein LptC [Variovorax sp. OK605]|jgi:lipopolysaccharide export system protein LptC|uniref:LPS export ABC transporter periplasmic protein LptC n=1 Tax=unclassified Variovorax TaxID=663243 RepID=UPI0008CF10C4|nr:MULTISPECIES: LPS export ABC transporter periplasmic protein LptC [unclassified Variovorax]SEJ94758.1 lipopolysaccharide export system protein LptC [Variovorax sp. OK202]SFD18279.1 lipopolysaccharide export system protein LptC [Variovorax sp. OK212]SFP42535.1 lipopolysaccharide export system protein LptC [Variovorax sp. OK605]